MKITKLCRAEHNPVLGCLTLQLGTPAYYRELDPTFYNIADFYEGSYYLDEVSIANHIYTNVRALLPNCYIFCATVSEQLDPKKIDNSYDSSYQINDSDLFYKTITKLLTEQLVFADLTEPCQKLLQNNLCAQDITVQIIGGSDLVKYVELTNIRSSLAPNNLEDLAKHYKSILFTKHNKFASDREIRFAFLIHHIEVGLLSVKAKPKILKIDSSLLECISI